MSYLNKLKKLRRMSPRELHGRLYHLLSQRKERKHWKKKSPRLYANNGSEATLLQKCSRLVPGTLQGQIAALTSDHPELKNELSRLARDRSNEIMHGRWRLLGHSFDLTGNVNWHEDCRSGYQWERLFHADLPLYNLPGMTDVKYPWELSRHQFLAELARNYLLNGCQESAARTRELMLDWIQENPIYEGVNWTSGLEVAMRAISWIWSLASLSNWDGWQDQDLKMISDSLVDHGIYLSDNFSHFSSPYNHLIGEATGLLWIASLLDDFKPVDGWRNQARQVLVESAPRQFYSDSFCVEQAVGYHYYTLGFLVLAWQAARLLDEPLEELTNTIRSGFETGTAFRRPDGTWPAVGDLDTARAIPVHFENYWSFDSLNHLAAVLFEEPKFKVNQALPGEELFWLAGVEGVACWQQMAPKSPKTQSHRYQDAGYVIASDDQNWLLFDAGPVAEGLFSDATPSTAHGHADTLQVLYHLQGENLLDDRGMPFYGGEPEWVTYFRSPAAHNTVQIEGAEFVRRAGRLAWSHHAPPPKIEARFDDSIWLCHGEVNWGGVSHQRAVCCLPGHGLWVADLICVDRPRQATWFWQLPDRDVQITGSGMACWDSMGLSMTCSSGDVSLELATSNEHNPEGWSCLGYGEKIPGRRLSSIQTVDDKLMVLTSLGQQTRPPVKLTIDEFELNELGENDIAWRDAGSLANFCWRFPASFKQACKRC